MPLRRLRPIIAAAAIAVTVAALAACAPAATPTPTLTPHFTSEAQAFKAAEDTYRAYVDATNAVDLSNPKTFEPVYALTTGTQYSDDKKALSAYHAARVTVDGKSTIRLLQPVQHGEALDTVELAACLDVSAVVVRDANGKSLVAPDRVDLQSLAISLITSTSNPRQFLISSIDGRSGGPKC